MLQEISQLAQFSPLLLDLAHIQHKLLQSASVQVVERPSAWGLCYRGMLVHKKKSSFQEKNCTPSAWLVEHESGKAEVSGFHPISSISSPNLSQSRCLQL